MKELELGEAKATLAAVVEAAENGEPTTSPSTADQRPWSFLARSGRSSKPGFRPLRIFLSAVPRLDPCDLPKRRPARIVRMAGLR
jgi:hypothetical protein